MDEKRRAQRRSCRFGAQIRFHGKTYSGQIIDLSASGMRLSVDRAVDPPEGWKVDILSEELGAVTGVVQWQRPGSFGVRLELSSNTRAKLEAAWKYYMAGGSGPAAISAPRTSATPSRSPR
jgi:hypothetical protein